MRRALNWIVGVPVVAVIAAFAVANRQWIIVSFDPLSREAPRATISMPLWALLFCGIFLGLVAGWLACWFAQKKWRRAAREARVELQHGQDELSRLKRETTAPQTASSAGISPA